MPALLTGSTARHCARGPGKAPKQTSAPFLPKQNTLCASFLGGGPRTFLLPRANRFSSLTCLGPGGQRHLPSGAASTGPALPLKAVTSGADWRWVPATGPPDISRCFVYLFKQQ